jgi:hypothetical protein
VLASRRQQPVLCFKETPSSPPTPCNPPQDPGDLSALPDPRHRQLARAFIAAVEADKRMEVYKARGGGRGRGGGARGGACLVCRNVARGERVGLMQALPWRTMPTARPHARVVRFRPQACSDTAKQLANVVESSQSTGLAAAWAALRRLLPIPFLR